MSWFMPLVTPAVAICLAWFGFWIWRWQLFAKRRFELAEEALATFEDVAGNLRWIRFPGSYSHEGKAQSNHRKAPESELGKKFAEPYLVTLERIGNTEEKFLPLYRIKFLCGVYFGDAARESLETILKIRSRVLISAVLLVNHADDIVQKQISNENIAKWKADVWEGDLTADPIVKEIEESRVRLDAMLRPHIQTGLDLSYRIPGLLRRLLKLD